MSVVSNPQPKKPSSISIHVRSDAPTTEQYQSQQSAVFNRYMRLWPRIYGPALLIFLKRSFVEI